MTGPDQYRTVVKTGPPSRTPKKARGTIRLYKTEETKLKIVVAVISELKSSTTSDVLEEVRTRYKEKTGRTTSDPDIWKWIWYLNARGRVQVTEKPTKKTKGGVKLTSRVLTWL